MKKILSQPYPLITVTGTKGKTTIIRLLDFVYRGLKFDTLRVDTDGHFVNGKQKSDYFYSREYWGMVPNNCPGRFLFELGNEPLINSENKICLLEAAIGSSSLLGLGYFRHNIGIWTNIYRDHITNVRIKNRKDIYNAKRFIFQGIRKGGIFIYNSSDKYLVKQLNKEKIKRTKIAVGYEVDNLDRFLLKGNYFFQINRENKELIFYKAGDKKDICNLEKIPFSFRGNFEPNLFNIAFVYAGLFAQLGERKFLRKVPEITEILMAYSVNPEGGRLVFVRKKDYQLIIDFAHEAESFKQIAKLAKSVAKNRVVGVLRVDPSRINKDIKNIAKQISKYYDYIYIYDKVDGKKMKESIGVAEGKKRGIGETANLLSKYLQEVGFANQEVVVEEDDALLSAVKNVRPGDVIVYIGDGYNHKETLQKVNRL
jgi:cyanophycin synthetase